VGNCFHRQKELWNFTELCTLQHDATPGNEDPAAGTIPHFSFDSLWTLASRRAKPTR
jgi:hypothetical protein